MLNAVDPVKPAAGNRDGESDRAPPSRAQGPQRAHSVQEKVCVRSSEQERPGWRADCKDLAQRLLFSEDTEDHAQRGAENIPALSGPATKQIENGQHGGSSTQ